MHMPCRNIKTQNAGSNDQGKVSITSHSLTLHHVVHNNTHDQQPQLMAAELREVNCNGSAYYRSLLRLRGLWSQKESKFSSTVMQMLYNKLKASSAQLSLLVQY